MPGILPGMQATTALLHLCMAAALHVQLVAEVCVRLTGLSVPMHGGGALVVGITKVPLPGALNSMQHREAVAWLGTPGLGGVVGGACHPCAGVGL